MITMNKINSSSDDENKNMTVSKQNVTEISKILKDLLSKAYAPYSNVYVSAIAIMQDNQYYTGINIENMSFTPSICAERCAIFKAISENRYRFKELHLMSSTKKALYPCGVCLQVMSEFFKKSTPIVIYDYSGKEVTRKMFKELFPSPMSKDNL